MLELHFFECLNEILYAFQINEHADKNNIRPSDCFCRFLNRLQGGIGKTIKVSKGRKHKNRLFIIRNKAAAIL